MGRIDLNDPAFERDPEFVKRRLAGIRQADSARSLPKKVRAAVFDFLARRLPLKKQVLFYTIRDDGRLEGNASALYPYIKGRKVIAARRLPHPGSYQLKMFWEIMRSRVIVTDDYVRYLRYFPLRKDQKVIQLWHACGAFKKFGRYGTNLKESVDLASHAQYDLVCVSGRAVRDIYADSFGIDREKVRALGAPRTDIFFDREKQEQVREAVYARYPQLRGRRVVLYAPTFRDSAAAAAAQRPADAAPVYMSARDEAVAPAQHDGDEAALALAQQKVDNVAAAPAQHDGDEAALALAQQNVDSAAAAPAQQNGGEAATGAAVSAAAGRAVFRPELDFDRLSEHLPDDMVFLVRPHPIMTAPVLTKTYDNVLEVRDLPTNDLMFVSDLMVTDYSSVIFEYSLLKKPMLFYCYDLDSYDRGFYLKYPDDLPGDVLRTQAELEERLSSDDLSRLGDGYEEFAERYMSACDGKSSRRIADIINRYMAGR